MRDGAEGAATAAAMNLLIRYGDALGCDRLCDVRNVAGPALVRGATPGPPNVAGCPSASAWSARSRKARSSSRASLAHVRTTRPPLPDRLSRPAREIMIVDRKPRYTGSSDPRSCGASGDGGLRWVKTVQPAAGPALRVSTSAGRTSPGSMTPSWADLPLSTR
jgi:hypothetical protein